MKDPFNLEPRNGDFATYVENLQKAELEKLRRANPTGQLNGLHRCAT